MNDRIVINASPLIALGKMGLFEVARKLPLDIITPAEVRQELDVGLLSGHSVGIPDWVEVRKLSSPITRSLFDRLDSGEAAVIQLALELEINTVCLDEIKGRRIAKDCGLSVTGSLGILGKARKLGIINEVAPFVQLAVQDGIYYDDRLIKRFLSEMGE